MYKQNEYVIVLIVIVVVAPNSIFAPYEIVSLVQLCSHWLTNYLLLRLRRSIVTSWGRQNTFFFILILLLLRTQNWSKVHRSRKSYILWWKDGSCLTHLAVSKWIFFHALAPCLVAAFCLRVPLPLRRRKWFGCFLPGQALQRGHVGTRKDQVHKTASSCVNILVG